MSQKNQSSSNDTSFTFAANAAPAQAINDTPGSAESGGGGTVSYRGPGSGASSHSFTVVNQAGSLRGSANRSTSARSPRATRPALWIVATLVAGARRARPRGRMRWADLLPHPNASRRLVLQGTRARHDCDVNFNTTSKRWKEVNELGLNWKIGWLCIKMFLHIVIKWSTM